MNIKNPLYSKEMKAVIYEGPQKVSVYMIRNTAIDDLPDTSEHVILEIADTKIVIQRV